VRAADAAGISIIAWTVDDPAEMRRLIDPAVAGIVTNYPERLLGVLAES